MPVAKMSKLSILAPLDKREELVERLHQLGSVHINDITEVMQEEEGLGDLLSHFEPQARELRLDLAKTEFLIELLERFEESKSGLVSGFIKKRVHINYEEFSAIQNEIDLDDVYQELEKLDVELRHTESEISRCEENLEALEPWKKLDCPMGGECVTGSVELRLAIMPAGNIAAWEEEMESACPCFAWEVVHRYGERVYIAVLVYRKAADEFDTIASTHDLEQVSFPGMTGTVEEEIALLETRLVEAGERKEGIETEIKRRLTLKPIIYTLNDYLYNRLVKEEVKGSFAHTERAVALEGWVEASGAEEVREQLRDLGTTLDVDLGEPEEEEVPPTLLVNRRHIRPAETLIQLFGLPGHTETDPTPFVAVFFILFFGMCIGDVGYGLILTLAFWLAIKKLDLSPAAVKFMRLFMYCGIASIVVGIFTRGYFGIDSFFRVTYPPPPGQPVGEIALPAFMRFKGTMDLLYDPVPFMGICLALGLIHISIGVGIEMYDNMRNNSVWLGICEQGTTLLSWLGIAVAALGFMLIKVNSIGWIGIFIVIAGIVGIIFLSNIQSKSIAGKFFGGLYNLYGLFASTIGDVASYLRLYALGLATIAIATVVNIMAYQIKGIPILGIIVLLIVLLGGHLFNLAVSFLSAFVHPLRLQYVEFFSKFYEDGGEVFSPFALETRKIVIDDR